MITLFNVSKKFRLYQNGRSILFKSILKAIRKESPPETIYALNNVNLDIRGGEVIGLIGPNGSGKSTLLKIICGIYKPTTGTARVDGKVISLFQLGFAFLPDLSVRDNIFLYGAIMGLGRKDIRDNLKKIIDFSCLQDFVDAEARVLSLGMEERLAFSIVIHAPSDILLLDETLTAGDRNFKNKALKIIEEFKAMGRTIIISSHDLNMLKQCCDRTLWLSSGHLVAFDNTGKVIDKYIDSCQG